MADVTFAREEYSFALPSWRLIDDVVAGSRAVKSRGQTYLPKPNPDDTSAENDTRYNQYLARAVFYNVSSRTLQGLTGAAFRKNPILDKPSALDYIENDIDGSGVSVYQQSQHVLREVLKIGRHGLLADYPTTEGAVSRADMDAGRVRATIASYSANQIINWRTERIGAIHKLVLVVLKERAERIMPDGFGIDYFDRYRVLRLRDGVYTQETWSNDRSGLHVEQEEFPVRNGSGGFWDRIPFTFVGSNNNEASIDPAPMYDMAEVSIAHYRNSADYEDSVYFIGQAQPWMSGLSEEWRNWIQEQGLYVGSRSPILLPQGGQFGITQAMPNTLAREAMDQKEDQMVALGARLIQPGSASKTATEAKADTENEHSVLSLAVANVNEAYMSCLEWMGQFMNVSGESRYEINQEFTAPNIDAQMLTALIQAWQSGKYPEADLWSQLRKYGLIDEEKDDEQIREELDTQAVTLDFE